MSVIMLMAGGTGGHLFPAMALAQELTRRGHTIHLMTDHRVASYGAQFPAAETHIVPSATPSVRNPVKFVSAGLTIARGIGVARLALQRV
jgi:UDP-N-acetylglucosamine--N-acetylmuramyl-(pentapeptide) pyrophosphoryl-undecaprenol N-acetylglucosamine transferase